MAGFNPKLKITEVTSSSSELVLEVLTPYTAEALYERIESHATPQEGPAPPPTSAIPTMQLGSLPAVWKRI